MGSDGEVWRVMVFGNLKNFKHYAKKPHISICPSVEPIQSIAVLMPKFPCHLYNGASVQSGGISEDFAEVRMVGGIKLIFDNHA